nr:tRNA(Ile)-lysidine synthetase [uncultured bacterium]QLG20606.1 tRNA(Ile)-lysidine synthetase [uncultured bacterium]
MAGSRKSLLDLGVEHPLNEVIKKFGLSGRHIAVAYSGGLDSTVLLHALVRVQLEADISARLNISAIHINHGLSPSADAWERHCQSFAEKSGVPFLVAKVKVQSGSGDGIEATARKVRHEALFLHATDLICMAHHADDQAETVLHNMLRGAGLRGASGIPEFHGRVLRPFLSLRKETLRNYALAHELSWVEDESNSDRYFTRNYLRHEVLPDMSAKFPAAVEQISRVARRFSEAQVLLDELALQDLKKSALVFPVEILVLRDLTELRARNLVRSLLSAQQVQLPDERRLNEFIRQVRTAASDRHPRLDMRGYHLWAARKLLYFEQDVKS